MRRLSKYSFINTSPIDIIPLTYSTYNTNIIKFDKKLKPFKAFSDFLLNQVSNSRVTKVIEDESYEYENITIIDGLKISSDKAEHYADGFLHPNKEGFEVMAEGIVGEINQYVDSGVDK
ncbi:MAG: hypothetical protein GX796_09655 [Clostridiaceae bacterium]|nr:hypothetical protein [Clostridiaceae bacterium]